MSAAGIQVTNKLLAREAASIWEAYLKSPPNYTPRMDPSVFPTGGSPMNASTSFPAGHNRIWRFVQFPLTRFAIALVFMIGTVLLLQAVATVTHFKPSSGLGASVAAGLTSMALMAAYAVYVRLIERRHVTELAATRAAPEVAVGFLLGGLLFSLIMLMLWLAGVATIGKGAGWATVGIQLLSALELGVLQAILVCGILFRIVEEGLGTWIALALTVVLFGAAHAAGPGASLASESAIGLEAGTLLAAVYVYSRGLWAPIGLLTAWNFAEGGVFGASVPGHMQSGLLVSRFHGPQILTGGAAGPEVSIVAVLSCLMVATWLFQRARRKVSLIRPSL